jgi:hypothetical protein
MFLFNAEDYELSLEQQFQLRKIKDEIENCTDIDALKEQTIKSAELLLNYQHLLSLAVKELLKLNSVGVLPPCEDS